MKYVFTHMEQQQIQT